MDARSRRGEGKRGGDDEGDDNDDVDGDVMRITRKPQTQ